MSFAPELLMIWSLPQRREPELMDDPGIAAGDHERALDALATINAVSRTAARLADAVRRLAADRGGDDPLVVVDVACGGGEITCDLARRLAARGVGPGLRVIGLDRSPRAVDRARHVAVRRGVDAMFEVRDVLASGVPACDVVVSSLFLHHLDDDDARALLGAMASAAACGIVVSDLIRSRVGLLLAVVGTSVLSSSRVARVDGPLSVRAARTPGEYRTLFASAGLDGATVTRVWPERVLVEWAATAARLGESS